MKKVLSILALAVLCTAQARADLGDASVAGQFNYASKGGLCGLGVQAQYEALRNFRVAPEFIYYFENDHEKATNVNLNLHYLITTYSGFTIYPIAGFSYVHFSENLEYGTVKTKNEWDHYGANLGCGAEYRIANGLCFFTEERFQIVKDRNQAVTTIGMKYTFNINK